MNQKNNIYIIDDVLENLQVLGNILKNNGFNISVARNGEQAVAGILSKIPDLILLDISMPEMDGYEVCSKLKSMKETADIPVIFLTARTQTEDIVRGFEVGGVDYLTKPFNSEELLSRVKTHLELKESKEKLFQLNTTKDQFFRIIGHDLRNPVSTLVSATNLLIEQIDDYTKDEILSLLKQLNKQSKISIQLLDNLLSWASSQTNDIEFNPSKIKASDLVNDIVNLLTDSAKQKGIKLTSTIEGNVWIFADLNMISSVLRNLCTNAIKFTNKGGYVNITYKTVSNAVEFSVNDNGVGIPPSILKNLFRIDSFHSTKGTANEKGSGLGLILCKEFVNKNGGELKVKSNEGEGSSFIFSLPKIQNEE